MWLLQAALITAPQGGFLLPSCPLPAACKGVSLPCYESSSGLAHGAPLPPQTPPHPSAPRSLCSGHCGLLSGPRPFMHLFPRPLHATSTGSRVWFPRSLSQVLPISRHSPILLCFFLHCACPDIPLPKCVNCTYIPLQSTWEGCQERHFGLCVWRGGEGGFKPWLKVPS